MVYPGQALAALPRQVGLLSGLRICPDRKTEFDVDAATKAAKTGMEALQGKAGSTRNCLVYSASICLHRPGRCETLAETVRKTLDSGAALARLEAARS